MDERNASQIIRKDARGCFVEVKSDAFALVKVHLEFATYDVARPTGQRQTNHVHIYIGVPEFLCLTQEAASGALYMRAQQQKAAKDTKALYESLGGTSAEKLARYGRSRPDGKSLSRIVKLIRGEKVDYLFVADSGPGETNAKGLIVPRFGNKPENHVSVGLSWRALNELLLTTSAHYQAWLAAKYTFAWNQDTANRSPSVPSTIPAPAQPSASAAKIQSDEQAVRLF